MISHTALYLLHDMSEDNEILFSVFDYWGSRESWTSEVKYTDSHLLCQHWVVLCGYSTYHTAL